MPPGSTAIPLMNGVGAAGVSTAFSPGDHVHPSDTSRVAKAGDTMTGNLQINAANPAFVANKAASGGNNAFSGYMNGVARWGMSLGNTAAESGSNAGSDFGLTAYSDTGATLGTWWQVQRSSGATTLSCPATSSPTLVTNQPAGTGASAVGYAGYIVGQRAGIGRWAIILGDNSAESGSNAGSNFDINGCNDAGTQSTYLNINRATAVATFYGAVSLNAGASFPTSSVYATTFTSNQQSGSNYFTWKENVTNTGGTTSVHYAEYIPGTAAYLMWTVNNQATFQFDNLGNAWKPSGGSWSATSDARIKTVIDDYNSGLAAIEGLRPVLYQFKGNDTRSPPDDQPDHVPDAERKAPRGSAKNLSPPYPNSPHYHQATTGAQFIGLIAQDAEVVMPEIVQTRDGFIDGVKHDDVRDITDFNPIVFALVNAVKELSARVKALEAHRA